MLDFCCDHNLRVSTHQLLPSESYTYISDSWGTESWLDHAVSSEDFHNAIDDIKICYNVTDEDHIPTTLSIAIELIPDLSSRSANSCMSKLNWENLSDTDCKKYTEITWTLLENIVVNDNIKCESISCNDTCHVEAVSKLYDDIINCLKEASDKAFPSTSNRGYTTMPGWSECVADLYKTSRDVREMWLGAGRPRNGHIFDLHMRTKARCKYTIRFIKCNEKQMRKESLAKKLSTLDNNSFWKGVSRKLRPRKLRPKTSKTKTSKTKTHKNIEQRSNLTAPILSQRNKREQWGFMQKQIGGKNCPGTEAMDFVQKLEN